jgi:hypothetical protein
MSHSNSTALAIGPPDPATVGTVLTRLGLGLVAVTVPLVAGAGAGLLANAGSLAVAMAIVVRAMETPLVGGSGLPWLFRLATLTLLSGCWILGAGLVADGLSD